MISWWLALILVIYFSVGTAIAGGFVGEECEDFGTIRIIFVFLLVWIFWIFLLGGICIKWLFGITIKERIHTFRQKRRLKKQNEEEDKEYDDKYDDERLIRLGIKDENDIWSSTG